MAASRLAPAHTTVSSRCNRDKSSAEATVSAPAKARTLLHDVQLCFLVGNERIRRHALHQENVATDGAARPDHRFAAEYGRVWINRHIILDRRVTLPALFDSALLVLLKAARSKRNAVIQLHPCPNFTALANDHAGTVIDKKVRTDFRSGMNIDTGAAVRPLSHDSRDERQIAQIKFMRHTLNGNGFQRGIREDDFLVTGGGWITLISRINIRPQHLAHGRQLRKESRQQFLSPLFHGGVWRIF